MGVRKTVIQKNYDFTASVGQGWTAKQTVFNFGWVSSVFVRLRVENRSFFLFCDALFKDWHIRICSCELV